MSDDMLSYAENNDVVDAVIIKMLISDFDNSASTRAQIDLLS